MLAYIVYNERGNSGTDLERSIGQSRCDRTLNRRQTRL